MNETAKGGGSAVKKFFSKNIVLIGLIGLCVVLSIASPKFLQVRNIMNILVQVSLAGCVTIGMTFVIITGGIDLSVGSIYAFAMIVGAKMMMNAGVNWVLACIVILIIGSIIGCAEGMLVSRLGMPAFIASLSFMSIFRGLSLVLTKGKTIPGLPDGFQTFGQGKLFGIIPYPAIVLIILFLIGAYILNYTGFGRGLYALGGNRDAARLSGIDTKNVELGAFIISGFTAAMAGILNAARLGTALPTAGEGVEMNAIGAAVIGGASLAGGAGTMFGSFIGTLMIGVINNAINLLGVDPLWQQVVSGVIILAAVLANTIRDLKKRSN